MLRKRYSVVKEKWISLTFEGIFNSLTPNSIWGVFQMDVCVMYKGILKAGALAAVLAVGLAGCAGAVRDAGVEQAPRQQVKELAAARWDALIAGDLARAYEYLSPGTRDVMSLDLYKKKTRPGSWKKASIDEVSCEQDRCGVTVVIEYSYRDMKSIETRLNEVWLQEGGKWWYVPRK